MNNKAINQKQRHYKFELWPKHLYPSKSHMLKACSKVMALNPGPLEVGWNLCPH